MLLNPVKWRLRVKHGQPSSAWRAPVVGGRPAIIGADRKGLFAQVGGSLPIGRVGWVEEIAQAVVMAMTNEFLTGAVLDIDGGHMVRA